MTRKVSLELRVDGDDEPLVLDSRRVSDGDRVGAYDLAGWMLETATRLIVWQSYRDRFDAIVEQSGEAS